MFRSLFRPGKIGDLPLKNRLIMAAMGNALADGEGCVTEAMLEYYRVRAAGGVGLVISQFASISGEDSLPYNLRLHEDSYIAGVSRLVEVVHGEGAKIGIQLMHPGMLLLMLKSIPPDQIIKVPAISALLPKERKYKKLNAEDIDNCVLDFVKAAERVKKSGADAIELHACHGCLLGTFLSPAINRRDDLFGGNRENRGRMVKQVIEQVKAKVGREFPLLVRINGDDDVQGGVMPEDVVGYAEMFSAAGADAISISSGLEYWSTLMAPSYLTSPGVIIPIAEEVKKKVALPIIIAGKLTPALAEKTIESGKVDFVALGRPLLADPELPNKLRQAKLKDISQCLYCNNCLRSSWRSCTVNPFLYREPTSVLTPSALPKKIMVVGGGLAGMQAAVLCKMRGHDVSLFEKEPILGGQWRVACSLPGKGPYVSAINFLKRELEKYQVKVALGREISNEEVAAFKADIVILATGALPLGASFAGSAGLNVMQANEVILGKSDPAGKIIVLGNTLLSMEVAVLLSNRGKEVVLISSGAVGGRKGTDDAITFRGLMRQLLQLRMPIYENATVLEASEDALMVRLGEAILAVPCDSLVVAAGVKAQDALAQELKGSGAEVYSVGDCVVPGNAAQATFSAMRLALKL